MSPLDRPRDAEVMVTLRPGPPPIVARTTRELQQEYRMPVVFAWPMASIGEECIVFSVPSGQTAEQMVKRLMSDPRVDLAQPVQRFATLGAPGPDVESVSNLQHNAHSLHLAQAHRIATGKGVRVGVIDTGVDISHPDLRGRIVSARNFVDRGVQAFTSDIHGTAVAGVIAANRNSEVGLIGVAPQAQIFALKACWQQPPTARQAVCDSYTLAKAIDFAIAQHVQVLNFSLAGPQDPLLGRLITTALERGVVVVAADSLDRQRDFPASLPGVIAVLGSDDLPSGHPPRQPPSPEKNELAAPGIDILSTTPHGGYDFFSGSSLAAAEVSGIAALLLERDPKVSPARAAALFRQSSRLLPAAVGDPPPAVQQIDACAVLTLALKEGSCS